MTVLWILMEHSLTLNAMPGTNWYKIRINETLNCFRTINVLKLVQNVNHNHFIFSTFSFHICRVYMTKPKSNQCRVFIWPYKHQMSGYMDDYHQ